MNEAKPQFLLVGSQPMAGSRGDARRIAYLAAPGATPGILWMQGFKSEMTSTKAAALAQWAAQHGRACVRFDYSGHGQSSGRFEDGTISAWLDEARAVFTGVTTGPQVVVGSSMGGWLALLLLRRLMVEHPAEAVRIKALVLIAPAWNMTEDLMWRRFPDDVRGQVMATGVWNRPSLYGEPYPITRCLIEDGRRHLLGSAPWGPGRPVVILHGRNDPDVPFAHSQALVRLLTGGAARLVEVPDGEHRLSRPKDIDLLLRLVAEMSVSC